MCVVIPVDDITLCGGVARPVHRADYVDLVMFPGFVPPVHVNDVVGIVYPEDWVGRVPMYKVGLPHSRA